MAVAMAEPALDFGVVAGNEWDDLQIKREQVSYQCSLRRSPSESSG